ncbi:hypothetical protein [Mucilaginibacter sp. 10I4]|uniref:hypothetical protein n=1 Tax=Mucilaginibacter sp. 10I4 TaxID=3048580 RepID=UPI002B2219B5|nr:hypothetical protein [Mucilaginibacter sp. 10I4]MEB0263484.1 hypothetical protein [Mucilaginibacter sp. 10I4]
MEVVSIYTQDDFINWIRIHFPDMVKFLMTSSIPEIFDEHEFPKSQKTDIMPSEINSSNLKKDKKS